MSEFLGKTYLVTGGSSGIGRGILHHLSAQGAEVINLDRTPPTQVLDSETFIACDLADAAQIDAAFAQITDQHAPLAGAVNNAGLTIKGEFGDFARADIDLMLNVNLRAVILCCQHEFDCVAAGGAVVNIGSVHVNATTDQCIAYAATKGGIVAMNPGLAFTFGRKNIRVNSLSPGLVRTEHIEAWLASDPDAERHIINRYALGRVTTSQEVAKVVAFLLSEAASTLTGTNIELDQAAGKLLAAEVPNT